MTNKIDLSGKRALITGAGGGIGRAVALRLSACGMKLALVDQSPENLVRTAALTGRPLDMLVLPVDLTQSRSIDDIMRILTGHFKGLDALVNTAGATASAAFEDTSEADYDRLMLLNARVPFVLCQRCLPLLRTSDCPAILNLIPAAAPIGHAGQVASAASRHALRGMTEALAREVAPEGIRVHLLCLDAANADAPADVQSGLSASEEATWETVAEAAAFLLEHRGEAVIDELRLRRPDEASFL